MNRGMNRIVLFYVLVIGLVSCDKSSMNRQDYVKYIENPENGLKKELLINDWKYSVQYKPIEYLLCKENLSSSSRRALQLKGTLWFTIQFQYTKSTVQALRLDIQSLDEYNQRLQYYLNQAQKDIEIAYGQATLYPISYLFETNYGLTPQETMIVGFALPEGGTEITQTIHLKYHDRIFRNGIIQTQFNLKDIQKIPQINLN